MGKTLTIRLSPRLARLLAEQSKRTGLSQGQIVRDQLEKSLTGGSSTPWSRWIGSVHGPKDLSTRKGFSRK